MSLPSRDDAIETLFPEFASGYSWYKIASPLTADTTACPSLWETRDRNGRQKKGITNVGFIGT